MEGELARSGRKRTTQGTISFYTTHLCLGLPRVTCKAMGELSPISLVAASDI